MEKQEFINGVVNEMTSILEQESLNQAENGAGNQII